MMTPPSTVEAGADTGAAVEVVGWDEILDRLEQALDSGVEFRPPVDVPAIPQRLLDRARSIMDRQAATVAQLAAERDRVAAEIAAQPRSAPRGATAAATGAARSL